MGTIRNEMTIVHHWKKDELEKVREDAIDIIQSILDKYEEDECLVTEITIGDGDIEALRLGIEALEQESTAKNDLEVDCIDRKATLNAIIKRLGIKNETYLLQAERVLYQQIKDMPSVEPQEPRWIPTSERLPKEDADVLVTLRCGLIGIMQKKLADDDNGEPCYIWQDFEGEEHEVVAWMPLPQPYKAESEN